MLGKIDLKAIRILISVLIILAACSAIVAGIRPSFLSEACSWRATDIVVVTEGKEIDGVFTVLESLKGDLKPGQTIRIPEMAEFKSAEARVIADSWFPPKEASPRKYITGQTMILFLIDSQKPRLRDDQNNNDGGGESTRSTSRWRSANPMGDEVKYSSAWIEAGEVYCFIQLMNPGPSLLTKGGKESELRSQITEVIGVQTSLNNARASIDPAKRAENLKPFVQSPVYQARQAAFKELAGCGRAALPVLRELLNDDSAIEYRDDVIDTLEAAGGKAIGPDLTAVVEKETAFWKATGPSLKPGWWNGEGFESIEQVEPLRTRWGVVHQALTALADIRYPGCEKAVSDFRDVIGSMPQLYFEQTSQICDRVLRDLKGSTGPHPKGFIPPYEVSFSGNKVFSLEVLQSKFAEFLTKYQELEEPYNGDMFAYAIAKLGDFFSTQGYVWEIQSSTGSNEHGVAISIDITEGVRYRLGTVSIVGATALSTESIRARLSLRSGDIADETIIRDWVVDIERSYKNLGYVDISANEDRDQNRGPEGSDADVVNIKISIDEGPRYKVGSIRFAGNSDVSEDDLRKALRIREGDVYSLQKVEASVDAINRLGLDVDKGEDVRTQMDETKHQLTLIIIVDKRTSRTLRTN
jgi:hypothetical protein